MSVKHYRGNIYLDSLMDGQLRADLSSVEWQREVLKQLTILFERPPVKTSQAVLRAINATKKKITIVPGPRGLGNFPDAGTTPDSPRDATDKGLPVLVCSGADVGNPAAPPGTGTGLGSDSRVEYTPQDYIAAKRPDGIDFNPWMPDEVLLHELVHGLRQARGRLRCVAMPNTPELRDSNQLYDNVEEFLAILIENIYRSEKEYPGGLVADHQFRHKQNTWPDDTELRFVPLSRALSDDLKFYKKWSPWIDTLCKQMLRLFIHLANVPADWNPIRWSVMNVLHIDADLLSMDPLGKLREYETTLDTYGW